MRNTLNATLSVVLASSLTIVAAQTPTPPPSPGTLEVMANARDDLPHLRAWDDRIDALLRADRMSLRSVRTDTVLEGRVHERYDQYVGGVRVFGGDVSRQVVGGVAESIFGTFYEGIEINTTPALSEHDSRAAFARLPGAEALPARRHIELVILPVEPGEYALAWRTHLWRDGGWWNTFIDAQSGEMILEYNDLQTQAAVGTGTGVLGDRKKISTRQSGSRFLADDQLRPPVLITYDMRGNRFRADAYLNGFYAPSTSDFANDADNVWSDAANVDAHVHLSWTYDYYFKRFGRRGLDDREAPIYAISHPADRNDAPFLPPSALQYLVNASWCGECGPSGRGAMVFGDGIPPNFTYGGQYVDYLAGALDVVAHELTHGLTDYSSKLMYRNESGALNESFSDMLGVGVEFFYHAIGAHAAPADYLIAEDVYRPGGIRSLANPGAFGDPDHYSRRFRGSSDNGGVHTNSAIPNHAFYLAIEGGVNRTSRLTVQGVGAANREQIEKVFYRAFVSMLPSNATFRTARAATIQSARDLYGVSSVAERAVTEAWTAVGVN